MPSAGPESDVARALGIEQSSRRSKRLKRRLGWGSLAVMVATVVVIWAMRDTARTVAFKTHPVQCGNLTVTVTATGLHFYSLLWWA